jgi:hypothetical protein
MSILNLAKIVTLRIIVIKQLKRHNFTIHLRSNSYSAYNFIIPGE